MRYRKLGKTEAEISEIGFGTWGIGGKQWLGGKDDESERALRRAFELGVNLSIQHWRTATGTASN
jgi:aryl-alcohol dehydrogenase-like predicted oxidoreductase